MMGAGMTDPRDTNGQEPAQGWARGDREPENWPRGVPGSIREAVSSRRDARGAEDASRREAARTPSRTAAARAERRRLDQPREPRRVRLPQFDPEAFGRWSEAIARNLGTPQFIVYMTIVLIIWFVWNTLLPRNIQFDPYTFTFLTLILSLQASYAAPLILLAQNRQADRDRLSLEEDRRRAAMQKADTEYLAREIAALRIALGEVATRDFVRSELNRLLAVVPPLLDLLDQVLQLRADPVAGGHLAEAEPQRGDLAGQVLGVGDAPLVLLAVLFEVDPVPVVLPVLRQQDQRSGVGGLKRQGQRQEDERVRVEAKR